MRNLGFLIVFCIAIAANNTAMAKCTKMTSLTGGVSTANEYLWTDTGAFYECGDKCDGGTTMSGTFRLEGKVQKGTFICMEEWDGDYWKKINDGDNCVLWTNLWGGNKTSNEYLWMPDESGFYECGDGCPNGTVKNGRFKLKEEVKTGRFVCHEEWNGDYWTYEDTSGSGNGTTPAKKSCNGKAHGTIENINPCTVQSLIDKHGATCKQKCDDGVWKQAIVTCKAGYTVDVSQPSSAIPATYLNCVPNGGNGNGGGNGGGTTPAPDCATSRNCKNNPNRGECFACCSVPSSVATWNASTNKCVCKDPAKKFNSASGQCVVAGTNPTAPTTPDGFKCPDAKIRQLAAWKIKCVNNATIVGLIDSIEAYCSGTDINETVFNNFYNPLVAAHPERCGATPEVSAEEELCKKVSDASMVGGVCKCNDANKELDREALKCVISASAQQESKVKIESSIKKIESLQTSMGKSVWKNKEGNFNTSRLASDGIAGVVLGTAGGLITSNVVKKNQIKGGFEDINCTIGGQVVSGWGDEFNVGISTR